jgi:hypothetical protein
MIWVEVRPDVSYATSPSWPPARAVTLEPACPRCEYCGGAVSPDASGRCRGCGAPTPPVAIRPVRVSNVVCCSTGYDPRSLR